MLPEGRFCTTKTQSWTSRSHQICYGLEARETLAVERRAFITPRIALRVWGKSRSGLLALCLLAGGIGVFASYAGTSGYFAQNREQPGNKEAKQPSGPVLAMGDTRLMRAVAEVYETDIARIKIGQVATITSRAFSHPITGKVVRIGNMVFKNDVLNVDPAARADARVVEVWIDLEDATLTERLTNLTVDVVINTGDGGAAVARSGQP